MTSTHPIGTGWSTGMVGLVWLSGPDRLGLLHRLSTNSVADMAPGQGRATVLLTDTGRVVDWIACHHSDDGTAVVTSHPLSAPIVADHLARYRLRDQVRITDATEQVIVHRLLGSGAMAAVAGLTGAPSESPAGTFVRCGEGTTSIWALRHTTPWATTGWDIVVPAEPANVAVSGAFVAAGLVPLTAEDYTRARIAQRVPRFGAEIDGSANPLELGLIDLIDFAKGCYVGQEVVARLDTYDKVQRTMVSLHARHPLAAGDVLRAAEVTARAGRRDASGRVTSAVADGRGGWIGLALVPSSWATGEASMVDMAGHAVAASHPPAVTT